MNNVVRRLIDSHVILWEGIGRIGNREYRAVSVEKNSHFSGIMWKTHAYPHSSFSTYGMFDDDLEAIAEEIILLEKIVAVDASGRALIGRKSRTPFRHDCIYYDHALYVQGLLSCAANPTAKNCRNCKDYRK